MGDCLLAREPGLGVRFCADCVGESGDDVERGRDVGCVAQSLPGDARCERPRRVELRGTQHAAERRTEVAPEGARVLHTGCGTSNYSFIWAMGGENQDYADMDPVPVESMR